MHIVYTYIAVDCAQSSKASWETFEATSLEKRCWNGTKARLGAAWWGDREERHPPSSTDEEKQGFIALKPQRPAFKGEDENSGVGVSSLSSGNETWPVAGVEKPCISKLLTSPVPRSVCTDTHTHTPIWFASRAPVETGTYIYPTNQHTHSPIVGYPSQGPSCIFTHLTFSPSSQKWVKRKSFCCVAQTGFECCISNQSQLCQGIFLKLSFPFFLIFGGGKAKRKINTFCTFCLRFITQPQSGAGESAKS